MTVIQGRARRWFGVLLLAVVWVVWVVLGSVLVAPTAWSAPNGSGSGSGSPGPGTATGGWPLDGTPTVE
ncbi:MAG TPA: hypothetical protein VGC37_19970, partial [Friedmanniella sp.]